ncbi:MAG TPA: 3-hydroxyacyl-CoA dehydrogenase family protein, partial [Hanamia sp.]|nr:3-hydroxyacyl-CoA dehydrogenase family protein [Hanamia sp.]
RVIGMHFFNPPYIMKLVEVVKGAETNEEVVKAIMDICMQMGKVPVLCKDSPGFIVNRVARPYYLESLKIAEEEIASFEDIDKILEATGFRMGPFRLMDLIGLDVNLATTESVYHAFNEAPRFVPSAIQKEKVKQNLLGVKTGRGFYSYKQE